MSRGYMRGLSVRPDRSVRRFGGLALWLAWQADRLNRALTRWALRG